MLHEKIRWRIFIASFFIISILLLSACRSKEGIKIGFVGGLTGNSSEIGVDGRNAVELAVDEVNKAGGIKGQQIELIIKDDKNDPKVALTVDKELIKNDVKIIIGHMTSGMTKLTIPLINEENVLMMSPTISLDSLTGIEDNFLRIIPSNNSQGDFLANTAFHKNNSKKIAIIYDQRNKAFAEGVIFAFKQKIEFYGGKIVIIEIFDNGNNVNYSRITKKIKDSDAEGILVIASSVDAAMFCQHFAKENINLPVLMPMWSMTNDLIKQGGPAVEGVYLVSYVDEDSMTLEYSQFRKKYYEKYQSEPSFASLLSYEATKILFDSMNEVKELTTEAIKENILGKRNFKGLQNEIVIDQYGDTLRGKYLYQVRNGAFVKVEE